MEKSKFSWDIIGHEKILNFLEKSIKSEKIAHSYLFYGPEGVGKATVAKRFSTLIQCEERLKNNFRLPCESCASCQHLARNIHPDVYLITREEEKKNVAIEQVRALQHKLFMRPVLGRYKIALIDEAETLTQQAWNSLLKTLEEPTPQTIIILITNKIQVLPKTIQSRSQLVHFLPVPAFSIFTYCVNELNIKKEKAQTITQLSLGRPGRALTFLKESHYTRDYEEHVTNFLNLMAANISERFKMIDKLISKNSKFLDKIQFSLTMLFIWKLVIRDLLLLKESQVPITNIQNEKDLKNINTRYSFTDLKNIINTIITTQKLLTLNINPKLALEHLVLSL